jgi:hypothetical protein
MSEWISCRDRLPEEGQRVRVKVRDALGEYVLPFAVAIQSNGVFYNVVHAEVIRPPVIAWRPESEGAQ